MDTLAPSAGPALTLLEIYEQLANQHATVETQSSPAPSTFEGHLEHHDQTALFETDINGEIATPPTSPQSSSSDSPMSSSPIVDMPLTTFTVDPSVSVSDNSHVENPPTKCYVLLSSPPPGPFTLEKVYGTSMRNRKRCFRMEVTFTKTQERVKVLVSEDYSEEPEEMERKYNGDLEFTFTRVAGAY